MKKNLSPNIGAIISSVMIFIIAYYILLNDTCFHTSIASIIALSENLKLKEHMLVLGLLPVYIATIVFGAAIFGLYLGSSIQVRFARILNRFKTYR